MTWLERISDVHAGGDRLAVADASGAVTGRELIGKAVAAAEYLTQCRPQTEPIPAATRNLHPDRTTTPTTRTLCSRAPQTPHTSCTEVSE
jgi:hypothetical protein